ncbi:hypothetical protein NL676_021109 [Syzygium grande]|nr:hypothetical protein NL676_021109 [Syzygium grande]
MGRREKDKRRAASAPIAIFPPTKRPPRAPLKANPPVARPVNFLTFLLPRRFPSPVLPPAKRRMVGLSSPERLKKPQPPVAERERKTERGHFPRET